MPTNSTKTDIRRRREETTGTAERKRLLVLKQCDVGTGRFRQDMTGSKINENEVDRCVRKAVEVYFKDLDGEKPHPIYDMVIRSVEKPLIELVMKQAEGNQTRAAELLGINRNTLRNKMKQYKIK